MVTTPAPTTVPFVKTFSFFKVLSFVLILDDQNRCCIRSFFKVRKEWVQAVQYCASKGLR